MSIIGSNVRQIVSVMKTKRLMFPEKWYFKNSSFWHFNSCSVLKHFFLDYWEKKHKLKVLWYTVFRFEGLFFFTLHQKYSRLHCRPWRSSQFIQKKCKTLTLKAILKFNNATLISLGRDWFFLITSMDQVGQILSSLVNRF